MRPATLLTLMASACTQGVSPPPTPVVQSLEVAEDCAERKAWSEPFQKDCIALTLKSLPGSTVGIWDNIHAWGPNPKPANAQGLVTFSLPNLLTEHHQSKLKIAVTPSGSDTLGSNRSHDFELTVPLHPRVVNSRSLAFRCVGKACQGWFHGDDLTLEYPQGAQVVMGGRALVPRDDGRKNQDSYTDLLALSEADPGIFESATYLTLRKATIPLTIKYIDADLEVGIPAYRLYEIELENLLIGILEAQATPQWLKGKDLRAIAFLSGNSVHLVGAQDVKLSDIFYIARLVEDGYKVACGTYVSNEGRRATLTIDAVAWVATLYDRTGRTYAKRRFEPTEVRCPTRTTGDQFSPRKEEEHPQADVEQWLIAQRDRITAR